MANYNYSIERIEELLDISYEERDWILFHEEEFNSAKVILNDNVSDNDDKEYCLSVLEELNNSIVKIKEAIDTIDYGMKTGIIYPSDIIAAYNDLSSFIKTYSNG